MSDVESERIRALAENPLLLLVSRWVALLFGPAAILGALYLGIEYAQIRADIAALELQAARSQAERVELEARIREREIRAFTSEDAERMEARLADQLDVIREDIRDMRRGPQ